MNEFETYWNWFNLVKRVHLCAGGTSSAFSGIFFSEKVLKFFNDVIFKVYFSILLNNFFKNVIWGLIFTQGVVSNLLKKWWWNCGQESARISCLKHGRKKSRYLLLNARGTHVGFCQYWKLIKCRSFFRKSIVL